MTMNPLYRTEKDRQEILTRRDAFRFADPEVPPKLVALIAGREGCGKTHLACTMSETGPVYLIDTEYRAQIVARKFKGVRFAPARNFMEMVVAVKHVLKHQEPGTIVLDSGSDLQTFAEIEYLERTEKEKVGMPWNWAEVWRLCNALIDEVKFSQKFNLVITSRVKEEYVNEKATGRIIPRIYSTLPYKADVVLQFTGEKVASLTVTKNGFTGDLNVPIARTDTLPAIIQRLSQSVQSGSTPPVASTPAVRPTNGKPTNLRIMTKEVHA
jgi:hypothetical protein